MKEGMALEAVPPDDRKACQPIFGNFGSLGRDRVGLLFARGDSFAFVPGATRWSYARIKSLAWSLCPLLLGSNDEVGSCSVGI